MEVRDEQQHAEEREGGAGERERRRRAPLVDIGRAAGEALVHAGEQQREQRRPEVPPHPQVDRGLVAADQPRRSGHARHRQQLGQQDQRRPQRAGGQHQRRRPAAVAVVAEQQPGRQRIAEGGERLVGREEGRHVGPGRGRERREQGRDRGEGQAGDQGGVSMRGCRGRFGQRDSGIGHAASGDGCRRILRGRSSAWRKCPTAVVDVPRLRWGAALPRAYSASLNTRTASARLAACVRRLSAAAALSSTSAAFCCVT